MKMIPPCKGRGRVLLLLGPDALFISPLRASQGGERFCPPGLGGRRALLRQGVQLSSNDPVPGTHFHGSDSKQEAIAVGDV